MRHLPNALTCGNLLCGCAGILYTMEVSIYGAAWFVWAACVFDFFDGFTARALKVSSPIGKELDSLADVVSFGVLPALVMYRLIDVISTSSIVPYVGLGIAAFSALRLAKFNIDENQKDSFIGLPTPANALLITALPFLEGPFDLITSSDILLAGVTALSCYLLVSPIELFALKFKNFTWADNKVRFTFIAISVLLLLLMHVAALPVIILLYVGGSLLAKRFSF